MGVVGLQPTWSHAGLNYYTSIPGVHPDAELASYSVGPWYMYMVCSTCRSTSRSVARYTVQCRFMLCFHRNTDHVLMLHSANYMKLQKKDAASLKLADVLQAAMAADSGITQTTGKSKHNHKSSSSTPRTKNQQQQSPRKSAALSYACARVRECICLWKRKKEENYCAMR